MIFNKTFPYLDVDPPVKINKREQKYALVSLVSPHGGRQKCNYEMIKVYGGFFEKEDGIEWVQSLNKQKENVDIFTVPIGQWIPWYSNWKTNIDGRSPLNDRAKEILENKVRNDINFNKRKNEMTEMKSQEKQKEFDENMKNDDDIDINVYWEKEKEKEKERKTTHIDNKFNNEFNNDKNSIKLTSTEKLYNKQKYMCISFISPKDKTNLDDVKAFKIRGVFKNELETNGRAKSLQAIDKLFHTYTADIGQWLNFDPEQYTVENQIYENEQLDKLMNRKKHNENASETFIHRLERYDREKQIKDAILKTEQDEKTKNTPEIVSKHKDCKKTDNDDFQKAKKSIETSKEIESIIKSYAMEQYLPQDNVLSENQQDEHKDEHKDDPQDKPKDDPQEVLQDDPQEVLREVLQDDPQEVLQDKPKDDPQDESDSISDNLP
jgi:hypothetical protein